MTEDTDSINLTEVSPGTVVLPPVQAPQRRQYGLIAAIVIFALLLSGVVTYVIVSQQKTIEDQATRISEQNKTIENRTNELVSANENAQDLYDQLIKLGQSPDGSRPTTVPGPQGDSGLNGRDGKDGTDGLNGKDGAPGTNGLDGKPGTDGTPGENGTNGINGTDGAPGKDGTNGKDGRGVASVECVASTTGTAFRFTFTDGTTQDIPAPCIPPTPIP